MAGGQLTYLRVFRRYGLDPDELFSDVFMAQMGALHDEIFDGWPSTLDASTPGPSLRRHHLLAGYPHLLRRILFISRLYDLSSDS